MASSVVSVEMPPDISEAQTDPLASRPDRDAILAILQARSGDPFAILGPHRTGAWPEAPWAVRAFFPSATSVEVIVVPRMAESEAWSPVLPARVPMKQIHPDGFFEAVLPNGRDPGPYRLRVTWESGFTEDLHDPYRFPPILSDFDLHLLSEGTHLRSYQRLGAHRMNIDGVEGVHFAVWAPNAERVSLIGDFNFWDARRYPMRFRHAGGIWELFLPAVPENARYKYDIASRYLGYQSDRSDPYATFSELRPGTASVVYDIGGYVWGDSAWMSERRGHNALDAPISIYEVHLGSWQRVPEEGHRWLTYRELADRLVPHAKEMGFSHIELLPVLEHPFDGSWGYQTTGHFAPTSRHGTPRDFMYFVDACHRAGLGVILDWVPSHFPRDGHALAYFDGTHLYEHEDPRLGEHPDWGTKIFNFGRNEVRNFLLSSALYWLEEYHIDGLRVDAVASMLYLDYSRGEGEWIPNRYGGRENLEAVDFLRRFNEIIHAEHPDVLTIAEESTAWPMVSRPTYAGGLGFDLKWNMGWMHDMLVYMQKDPIFRRYHQNDITFSLMYAFTENFILPLSHDEVVHMKSSLLSKMPGDDRQKFANLRAFYGYMIGHPGKKLLFMGGEFGQWDEWNHDASLDWHLLQYAPHQGMQRYVRDILNLYRAEPALHQVDFDWHGFEWIDFRDADSNVIAFLRRARDPEEFLLMVCNFSRAARQGYRLGVPRAGLYWEILNSDGEAYGGTNVGNGGAVMAVEVPYQDRPCSIELTLPPLATIILKPDRR